jgi:hypothetical protein
MNIVTSLVLAAYLVIPVVAKAGDSPFITYEEAVELYATDIDVPSAELLEYDIGCTTKIELDGTSGMVPWTTGLNAVQPFIIGAVPFDPEGSSINVSDPALGVNIRVSITATVTFKASKPGTVEMIATYNGMEFPVVVGAQIDAAVGQRRSGAVGSALRNVPLASRIRLSFRSVDGPMTLFLCKVGLKVVVVNKSI